METMDAIVSRRSVREYQDKEIPEADLKEILEAALWAPSGVNLQPWYFVVIRDKEKLAQLAEVMGRVACTLEPAWRQQFARHPVVADETARFVRRMGGAPVCVLVFALKDDYGQCHEGGNELTVIQGLAAAVENLLLAATDKGLGSCWLTAPAEAGMGEELRAAFAPGKGPLAAMVTLGYAARAFKAPPRKDGRYVIL